MNHYVENIKSRSDQNGIVFFSNIAPAIGVKCSIDDSGEIKSTLVLSAVDTFLYKISMLTQNLEYPIRKSHVIIFDVLLICISILIAIHTKNAQYVNAPTIFALCASFPLYQTINISYITKSKNKNGYSKGKFHAAEHMVLNAYYTLKRIPTVEESKKFSRFSESCGSRSLLYTTFSGVIISITALFSPLLNLVTYFLLVFIVVIACHIAYRKGWLTFLEVFSTSKPTNTELEVAIHGLKRLVDLEAKSADEIIQEFNNQDSSIVETYPCLSAYLQNPEQ